MRKYQPHEVWRGRSATPEQSRERMTAIVAMRQEGKSLREIGDAFDISRERARQILEKARR